MNNRKIPTEAEAYERLAALCNAAEYCTQELLLRMRRRGVPASAQDAVLKRLRDNGLLDDARYARSTARYKAYYARWGKIKIRLYLRHKGISPHDIAEAVDDIDEDRYEEALLEAMSAKWRQLGPGADSYEGRTKLYRHALQKGYESPLIARLIRENFM